MLSWIQTIQNAQQRMMAARLQYSLSSKGPAWADEVDRCVLLFRRVLACVFVCLGAEGGLVG